MDKENEKKLLLITNSCVKKFKKLLKQNLNQSDLHDAMLSIIENVPKQFHNSIMMEFTYLLGYHYGLTYEQITKTLIEGDIEKLLS